MYVRTRLYTPAGTPIAMGGIHPRSKKPVGDRLAKAAFNTVYGGKQAYTGPTIAGCALGSDAAELTIKFDATLLAGSKVEVQEYNRSLNMSYLEVMTDASAFCVEPQHANTSNSSSPLVCPSYMGGSSITNSSKLDPSLRAGWQSVNISVGSDGQSIVADLTPLNGLTPIAVRYAWGVSECCDKTDPMMYVTKTCGPAACPIMGSSGLPANPWIAEIAGGKCRCVAPQVCDA